MRKSRLAWCLGMPQMPLPPLTDISVLTGRSYTYWPDVVVLAEEHRQRAAGAGRVPWVTAMAMLNSMYLPMLVDV